MKNRFDILNEKVNDVEGSLVNFLTAFAPWLAPLVPAYMTYDHMTTFLKFPSWLALVLALVVEILGFGTVSTYLAFWFYNRRERAKGKKAPIEMVVLSFGFYLGLVVVSNVVIDIAKSFGTPDQLQWSLIAVRVFLTLQMIPAAIIVGVRTQHRGLLREIKVELERENEQELPETFRKLPEEGSGEEKEPGNLPNDWRSLRPTLSADDLVFWSTISPMQVKELSASYKVDVKTITNWRARAKAELDAIAQTPPETPLQ